MRVADFDFELPPERIAQAPAERRDDARLMVVERDGGAIFDSRIDELGQWLTDGDLLVLNDTRVVPARLLGRKSTGGRVELLLLEPLDGPERREVQTWHCLLRASRLPANGARLRLPAGIEGRVCGREGETWTIALECAEGDLAERLGRAGSVPLPPYIRRPDPDSEGGRVLEEEDRKRYQTVFARKPGAVAAPTAGLHFTDALLRGLRRAGIGQTYVTLHVGAGTFQPVRVERVEEHRLHDERFEVPEAAARAVQAARDRGGRVVAVGTTVVRVLEHRAAQRGTILPGAGRCGLFIYPGFEFRVVDALLTNFHLPRSTLLMLVCAFAGRELVLEAYAKAVERGYRFYSYGDAMLLRSAR